MSLLAGMGLKNFLQFVQYRSRLILSDGAIII